MLFLDLNSSSHGGCAYILRTESCPSIWSQSIVNRDGAAHECYNATLDVDPQSAYSTFRFPRGSLVTTCRSLVSSHVLHKSQAL